VKEGDNMNRRNLFDDFNEPESDGRPPHQRHSETSGEAADVIAPDVPALRLRVYEFIAGRGARGATDEEVQDGLGMNPSTQRPRRVELYRSGLVKDGRLTRLTKARRRAVVWTAVPPDEAVPNPAPRRPKRVIDAAALPAADRATVK
jgi:hypothetical protein